MNNNHPPVGYLPVEEVQQILRLIENGHPSNQLCACCETDAIFLRDLVARYAEPPKGEPNARQSDDSAPSRSVARRLERTSTEGTDHAS